VTLDLVIPMFNEEAVLPALLEVLQATFSPESCRQHRISRVSCVFVDDGSWDASVRVVRETPAPSIAACVVRLSRNFGHQAAVTAGLDHSTADLVAILDADLQDPPDCVLDMIARWREGFDIVYGQRRTRQEGPLKTGFAWAFYRVYRLLSPIAVPLDSGDFCLMSRRVVDELCRLPERVRFPRGLRSWIGFRQAAVPYDRPARHAGTSRYGWRELYRLATDGIAAMSLRPLQLAQVLALAYFLISVAAVAAYAFGWLRSASLQTQISLILLLTIFSNGLVLFCLYVLGAYLGRAYLEVKGRPPYVVAEVLRPPDAGGAA